MSAVSRDTNRRCSSNPTRARYSPKVMPPASVRSIASRARSSLFLGMATRPIAARRYTPIHSTSPPSWRLSAPAIARFEPCVTRRHASSMRMARSTPTTADKGSSVYMVSMASRVCLQSLRAIPLRFGRRARHCSSSGPRRAIHSSHMGSAFTARASASSWSNSSSAQPVRALEYRCAMFEEA